MVSKPARARNPCSSRSYSDDDSVIEFYEDFAKLAFGDSRGSVTTRCKLLKYRTKEDQLSFESDGAAGASPESRPVKAEEDLGGKDGKGRRAKTGWKAGIAGEAGMHGLGAADGKVECSYCWTVKRDVFDIPMLIIMNVSITLSSLLEWIGEIGC